VVRETIGDRAAHALVKEDKELSSAGSLVSQAIGVTFAIAFD
jgi:hypothetical protein